MHKQETPEEIQDGIKLLLKKSPSLDKKVLDIFTRSAESARLIKKNINRFSRNKNDRHLQMGEFQREAISIELGLSALIKTNVNEKV